MTQIANILENLASAEKQDLDPGDAGTIRSTKFFQVVPLVSTGAQTRTLAAPVAVGQVIILNHVTDAGDITLTVTGGYDETGSTVLTFSDPGQAIGLVSVGLTASTYGWRILFNEGVAGPGSAGAFSVLTFAGATGVPEIRVPSNLADALSIENAAGALVAQVVTTTNAMALHVGDDVMLGVGDSNDARFSWDTTDANANEMLLQMPAGTGTNVPVLVIGQSIESVDLGLYNGVVDPRIAIFGVGAVTTAPVFEFRKARGTVASPTVVTSGDDLGTISFHAAVAAGEYVQSATIRADASGTIATTRGPGNLSFNVATDAAPSVLTERLLITGSGQINLTPSTDTTLANGTGLVIGHTAQYAVGAVTSELEILGTAPADSTMSLQAWSADAVAPRIYFAKSRSATIGTPGIITSGDNLGEILAFGDDGVDFNSNGNASCGIIFDSAGTIAADRIGGVVRIQTATDAAPSVLTTGLTVDQTQTVTCAAGLVVQTATAAAIVTTRTLTAADSGGTFSVAKGAAYAITLPTPAPGLKFKFMVLDTGANAVTISNGSAHLFGVVSVFNINTAMTGTTLTLASGGSVGDWVEFEGIDATHYLVTGSCIAAADITIA